MRHLTFVLATLVGTWFAAGCAPTVRVESAGVVSTGGGSTAVYFADLDPGQGSYALVTSTTRGVIDLFTPDPGGTYAAAGSFYVGVKPTALASGHVAQRGAVAVVVQDGTVALALAEPDAAARLDFPVQVYHHQFDGHTTDGSPPARDIALGDLWGDSSDELVVAAGPKVYVLEGLAAVIGADPESPPAIGGIELAAGPSSVGTQLVDFDGDGRRDVLVVDEQIPMATLFRNLGGRAFAPGQALPLPARGTRLLPSACPGWPALALLDDGRAAALSPDGAARVIESAPLPLEQLAPGAATLAVVSQNRPGVSIYDPCLVSGAGVHVDAASVWSVAMAPRADAHAMQPLAVLDADGEHLSLLRVSQLAGTTLPVGEAGREHFSR